MIFPVFNIEMVPDPHYSESALGRGLSCLGPEIEPLSKFPVSLSMSEATSVGNRCDLMSPQTEVHVLTSLNKKFKDT